MKEYMSISFTSNILRIVIISLPLIPDGSPPYDGSDWKISTFELKSF